ncbi:MAG: TatD family hydrolase [Oscillospiraceae bacterium]|nr:TatD family hydrolase [Oscillospiraceae bacterium]
MEQTYQNIFDTHAHYDHPRFDKDRQDLLTTLPSRGIKHILNAAADIPSAKAGIKMAETYEYIYASAGIHPHEAKDAYENYIEELAKLLTHPKVKAVGEIGLDYHYDFSPRETQLSVFEAQLKLAKEQNKPVIIHDREAHQDTMNLLKKYKPSGVVHCYSGSAEMAGEIIKLGMYIGFTGVVTFSGARKALEAIRAIPADRLVIETDCPYMAPEPKRGRRCDSSLLPYTAAAIAKEKGMDIQALINQTTENAHRLFEI